MTTNPDNKTFTDDPSAESIRYDSLSTRRGTGETVANMNEVPDEVKKELKLLPSSG